MSQKQESEERLRATKKASEETVKIIAESRQSTAAYRRAAAKFRIVIEEAREALRKLKSN